MSMIEIHWFTILCLANVVYCLGHIVGHRKATSFMVAKMSRIGINLNIEKKGGES